MHRLGGVGEDGPEILPLQVRIAFQNLLLGPAGSEERESKNSTESRVPFTTGLPERILGSECM